MPNYNRAGAIQNLDLNTVTKTMADPMGDGSLSEVERTGAPDGFDPYYEQKVGNTTFENEQGTQTGQGWIDDKDKLQGYRSTERSLGDNIWEQDNYDAQGKYVDSSNRVKEEYSNGNLLTDFVKLAAVAYGGGALLTAGLGAAGVGAAGGAGGAGAAEAAAVAADTAGGLIPAYGTNAAYATGLGMTEAGVASLGATVGSGGLTAAETAAMTAAGDIGGFGAISFTPEVVAESISSAVGNNFSTTLSEWASSFTGGGTSGGGALNTIGSAAKSATAWLKQNAALANILGSGVAALAKGKADDKLIAAKNNELERAREDQRNEENRYRASVTGMRKPGGLIQQAPLARTDGSQIFNARGLINRA